MTQNYKALTHSQAVDFRRGFDCNHTAHIDCKSIKLPRKVKKSIKQMIEKKKTNLQ